MKFTFYPSFREKEINNAMNATGAVIKKELAAYTGFPENLLSITIDDKVLEDRSTPASIGVTDQSIGFCFIAVPEPDLSVKSMQGSAKPMVRVSTSTTRASYTAKAAPTQTFAPRVLTDSEYARQEIDTGKYTSALRDVYAYPALKTFFMNELKNVNTKLFNIFSRQDNLLMDFINRSGSLRSGQAAITLLRDDDRNSINFILECVPGVSFNSAASVYLRNNRDANRAINELM